MRKGEKRREKENTNPFVQCLDEQTLTQTSQTDFICAQFSLCITHARTQLEFGLTRQKFQTSHWLTLLTDLPFLSLIWKFHPPIPEQYPVQMQCVNEQYVIH